MTSFLGTWICPRCGKIFKNCNQMNFMRHFKYVCGVACKYRCSAAGCTYQTKRRRDLKRHIFNMHTETVILTKMEGQETEVVE